MPSFEDTGRVIDRELEKLRTFLENEVRPVTKQRAVEALRSAARRLADLAEKLERNEPNAAAGPTDDKK